MSMFDDCHGSKRQKVPSRPSVSSSPDHQESPESSVDLESNPGDIEEIFSGKELQVYLHILVSCKSQGSQIQRFST